MSGSRMHDDTFAVLRHIEVHGPRTRAEIVKGTGQAEKDVTKRLANLSMLGYLAWDTTCKPSMFSLTGKARQKLAAPDAVYPRRPREMPKKPIEASTPALSVRQASTIAQRAAPSPLLVTRRARTVTGGELSAPYRATEYAPSPRPGANVAFTLPSRFADTLRWRDGRVTDLDGNPLS